MNFVFCVLVFVPKPEKHFPNLKTIFLLTEREREGACTSFTDLLPEYSKQQELGQAEAGTGELNLDLHCGWQGPSS